MELLLTHGNRIENDGDLDEGGELRVHYPTCPNNPIQRNDDFVSKLGSMTEVASINLLPTHILNGQFFVQTWNLVCSASYSGESHSFDLNVSMGQSVVNDDIAGNSTTGTAIVSIEDMFRNIEIGGDFGIAFVYRRNSGSFPQFSCQFDLDAEHLYYNYSTGRWAWPVTLLSRLRIDGVDDVNITALRHGDAAINDTSSATVFGEALSCEKDAGYSFSFTATPTAFLPLLDP